MPLEDQRLMNASTKPNTRTTGKLRASPRAQFAGAQRQHDDAIERARDLAPLLTELCGRKLSLRAIAGELTKRKIKTPRGGKWHASSVRNLLRYAHAEEAEAPHASAH
jgi:hypothetical protein